MWRFRREWIRFRSRFSGRDLLVALAVTLALVGAGVAGYVIGTPPGVDVDGIREAATADGRDAGLAEGAEAGFTEGFEATRKQSYDAEYAAAYREAYANEFELVGLDPPESIPEPSRR
jgi:hypothetical protein